MREGLLDRVVDFDWPSISEVSREIRFSTRKAFTMWTDHSLVSEPRVKWITSNEEPLSARSYCSRLVQIEQLEAINNQTHINKTRLLHKINPSTGIQNICSCGFDINFDRCTWSVVSVSFVEMHRYLNKKKKEKKEKEKTKSDRKWIDDEGVLIFLLTVAYR